MRGIITPVQSIGEFPAGSGGGNFLYPKYGLIKRYYNYSPDSGNNYGRKYVVEGNIPFLRILDGKVKEIHNTNKLQR